MLFVWSEAISANQNGDTFHATRKNLKFIELVYHTYLSIFNNDERPVHWAVTFIFSVAVVTNYEKVKQTNIFYLQTFFESCNFKYIDAFHSTPGLVKFDMYTLLEMILLQ